MPSTSIHIKKTCYSSGFTDRLSSPVEEIQKHDMFVNFFQIQLAIQKGQLNNSNSLFCFFIKKHFGVAFETIDLDGDGLIDYDEFCKWYELRCADHGTTKVRVNV